MFVEEALDVLAQEIGFVFDAAVAHVALDAPLFEGVFGDVEHDEQVGKLNPVEEDRDGMGVVILHRQALLSTFVHDGRSWKRRGAHRAPGASCGGARQSIRRFQIS